VSESRDLTLDCEVVATDAGALAMRDRLTGEVMHPIVGPRAEAESLYVGPSRLRERLLSSDPAPLVLFDIGLGAGSNASFAWQASEALPEGARRLEIVSFDRSLAALLHALSSAHAAEFGLSGKVGQAAAALARDGGHETARTCWRLRLGELPATLSGEAEACAEVVFWDPFSPRANPTLWTYSAFQALYGRCRQDVSVHTYSGATAVRSALLLAGFAVGEGEPSAAAKRTTCAARDARNLARPLDRRWFERLIRSSAPLPSDAPPDALELIRKLAQFA
jgi:queuine tRNA-ribosyltransferase